MHWIDPRQLSVTKGHVERLLYNPHGETDGLLLDGGREVHVPPHLGEQLRAAAAIGAPIVVRGLRPRDADMICAVSFGGEDGLSVLDEGPPEHREKPDHGHGQPMSIDGAITRLLHGAKGEVRGALLDNGVQLRWKKHDHVSDHVGVGDWLVVEGEARYLDDAIVIDVEHFASRRASADAPSA